MTRFTQVVKRTGATVPFTPERITNAIYRAAVAVGGHDRATAEKLTDQVIALMEQQMPPDHIPAVEEIQDVVEKSSSKRSPRSPSTISCTATNVRAHAGKRPRSRPNLQATSVAQDLVRAGLVRGARASQRGRAQRAPRARRVSRHRARIGRGLRAGRGKYGGNSSRRGATQVKIVIIRRASSSGKTTTTIKLGMRLEHNWLKSRRAQRGQLFLRPGAASKDEYRRLRL